MRGREEGGRVLGRQRPGQEDGGEPFARVVVEDVGELDAAAGATVPPDGMYVPVKCQKAENPLKGPPTTWLDHCRV